MDYKIDNFDLVREGNTVYSAIIKDGVVQVDSRIKKIHFFCEDDKKKFEIDAADLQPRVDKIHEGVEKICLWFKDDDPLGRVSISFSIVPGSNLYYISCRSWLLQFFRDCGFLLKEEDPYVLFSNHPRYIPSSPSE